MNKKWGGVGDCQGASYICIDYYDPWRANCQREVQSLLFHRLIFDSFAQEVYDL